MSAIEVRGGNCLNTHGLETLTRSFWWMRQQVQLTKSALKIMTDRSTLSQITKLQIHFHQGFGIQPAVFEKCAPGKS